MGWEKGRGDELPSAYSMMMLASIRSSPFRCSALVVTLAHSKCTRLRWGGMLFCWCGGGVTKARQRPSPPQVDVQSTDQAVAKTHTTVATVP